MCVNFAFTDTVYSAPKNANNLAQINKQIAEKKRTTALLEKQKKQLSEEIRATQNKMVAIANNVKTYERQISGYDKQLATLKIKERILNKKIEQNNAELIKIIAVFENIAMVPKGYLFFSGTEVNTFFNTSVLLRTLVDELNQSKVEFTNDLNELISLKKQITDAKFSIYTLNNKVKGEKDKIASLIKSKKSTQKKLNAEQEKNKREINKLVAESKTIEEFLKKAERLRRENEQKRKKDGLSSKFVSRKSTGTNTLPIEGTITTYFGDEKTSGVKSKGIYLTARSGVQVISPSDAEVVFSGSFYGYKNLLILHTSDNYYLIMGGMSEIFADEGQSLLAGEPVGEMGVGEFYIELRDRETPINPLKYFKI